MPVTKKIKVKLDCIVHDQLLMDAEDFGVKSASRLYNLIFERWISEIRKLADGVATSVAWTEQKEVQFHLSAQATRGFEQAIQGLQLGAAEIARLLFTRYANLPRHLREEFVKNAEVVSLQQAIAIRAEVALHYRGEVLVLEPSFFAHSKGQARAYVVAFDLGRSSAVATSGFRCLRLAHVEHVVVHAKNSAGHWSDPVATGKARGYRRHFDPFLSHDQTVVARLTAAGVAHLHRAVTNRPTWDTEQVEAGTYLFQCSPLQAQLYFPPFFDEVEILEPKELRAWFRDRHTAAAKKHK